jgi:N-acetylglucosamine-6-sulfatase
MIDQFHQVDAPFFLFTSWTAPHKDDLDQYNSDRNPKAPPRYHRVSDANDFDRLIARKPSFNEPDVSDKTPDLRHQSRANIARDAKPNYTGRVAALRATDEAITQIIDHLKDVGEFDNTLFVLTSDNGFLNGEHRLLYKKWEFEESLAVPLFLSWPDGGIPVGVTDRSATLVDVPATILAAAGATSQRSSVDGISLLDTVPTTVRHYQPTPLLIGSGRENASPEDPGWSYQGVKWGPYTWTRHWGSHGAWTGQQFYDLQEDPYQIRSQATNPWYRKNIIITMKQYFADLKGCAGPEQCVPPDRRPILAYDPDHDGLWSWYERHVYGTDLRDPDTDGDGFRDGKDRHPLDPHRH